MALAIVQATLAASDADLVETGRNGTMRKGCSRMAQPFAAGLRPRSPMGDAVQTSMMPQKPLTRF